MQLSRKAPLINSISMQTHRRCSFWVIQADGTHTHACMHLCTGQTMCPLLKGEERHSIFPLHLIHLLGFSLGAVRLSHILPLPSSANECASVSDRCFGATHTHLSADVTAHCSLCVSVSVGDGLCWIVNGRKCCTSSEQSAMNESGENKPHSITGRFFESSAQLKILR